LSPATPLVTGVDFATVFVTNYDEAAKFYGTVLGLPCSSDYERIPGGEFETGSLTLLLMQADAVGFEFQPSKHPIAMHVEAARTALESQGVSFSADNLDSGVCHMAFFEDPDGNTLILHNRYAPRASG
jgi:catechol 2,3-dioxygenase-like lactoylglutathione lyase family enzyme